MMNTSMDVVRVVYVVTVVYIRVYKPGPCAKDGLNLYTS